MQGWPSASVWALGWQGFVPSGSRAGVPTLLVQTLVFAKHPLLSESAVRFMQEVPARAAPVKPDAGSQACLHGGIVHLLSVWYKKN